MAKQENKPVEKPEKPPKVIPSPIYIVDELPRIKNEMPEGKLTKLHINDIRKEE